MLGLCTAPHQPARHTCYATHDNIFPSHPSCLLQVRLGLYVGGMAGAHRHADLKRVGVTHVLCMADYGNDDHAMDGASFCYKVVRVLDTSTYDISRHFDEIHSFIAQGRAAGGVYVHCMAGVSRAAVAILVYLMRSERLTLVDAYDQLKMVRPCVQPNPGFWHALRLEEQRLRSPTLRREDSANQTVHRQGEDSPGSRMRGERSSRQDPTPSAACDNLRHGRSSQPGQRPHPRVDTMAGRRVGAEAADFDGMCSAPHRRPLKPFGQVGYISSPL